MTKSQSERRRRLGAPADGAPGFNYRAIVSVDWRVMYMALNKNACTTLKWMMADICGETPDEFRPLLQPYVALTDAVHNRRLWKSTPRMLDLDPLMRSGLCPANGWFVFAVVRDPRVRLFSAWQNKFLLDHPGYAGYRDASWYPRHPASATTIIEDFQRFVRMLASDPGHDLLREDGHFRSQHEMLMLDTFEYTRLYDISELSQLRGDLGDHLAALGRTDELRLGRFNDTPLRARPELFDRATSESIERIYRTDFIELGSLWRPEDLKVDEVWDDTVLAEVELRAAFGRRLSDLIGEAQRIRGRLRRSERRNDELRARIEELERRGPDRR